MRKRTDNADTRLLSIARFLDSGPLNRSPEGWRVEQSLRHSQGARNGQHESRGVTEVAVELDRPGTLRKLVVQIIQFEVDIAEFFLVSLTASSICTYTMESPES